jgi:hypothetical protein
MARGWESKSIEAQQDEASRSHGESVRQATAEDLARRQQRRTLELGRARAAADFERATTDAHRAMLRRAIADLDERLGRL